MIQVKAVSRTHESGTGSISKLRNHNVESMIQEDIVEAVDKKTSFDSWHSEFYTIHHKAERTAKMQARSAYARHP